MLKDSSKINFIVMCREECYDSLFFLRIYLFELQRERKWSVLPTGLFPKWPRWPGMGQTEGSSFSYAFHMQGD